MVSYSLYVIDDEQSILDGLVMQLEKDYAVQGFSTAEAAMDTMKNAPPDLVLLDIGLPGMNGIEALREIKKLYPDILVIMITAFEDINTVIAAMKLGAYDYVVKPIHMDGLEVTIHNALENIALRKEVRFLQQKYLAENLPCFIGESNAIQEVMEFIARVAKSPDTPVLILGETGTGKELIAGAIHYRSPNFKGQLVTVNCSAIPKDLIESELFGYEKGAFSGAHPSGKKGLIEAAQGGTLFLDEVGDLSLEAQSKLLRFLEEGEFYQVGGTTKINVKTRVVSATNKDLDGMMEKELFRRDLFFRLSVVKVQVPSLKERPDDIIPIAKYYLAEFTKKFGKTFSGIAPRAVEALMSHAWTGNVRELKNIIERAVLVGDGPEITMDGLALESAAAKATPVATDDATGIPPFSSEGIDIDDIHRTIEKNYFEQALRASGGNESKAARMLNIKLNTFRYRKSKLSIK